MYQLPSLVLIAQAVFPLERDRQTDGQTDATERCNHAAWFLVFLYFSFLCRALDKAGHLVSFKAQVNLPYRIVSVGVVAVSVSLRFYSTS